ncbi:OmpA family protein [Parerythrobacter aurantius]|uniref:OmpA family protein n=1 Tax=Parerythrobacter aurantius TaxID=3127706 RepID=UPI00324A6C74
MRKLVIGMALASTAIASPALARDDAWYVEVDGGVMIVEDLEFDVNGAANDLTLEAEEGYDFGGLVGYDFGPFRLEAEASYREADIDSVTAGVAGFPARQTLFVAPAGAYPASGEANALSFMVNGLFDFGPDDGLQAFVGGGVGVARTAINARITESGPAGIDDSDSGFAWQILAGVRAPLNDRWDVGVKYRLFNAAGVELVDRAGRDLETRFRSHSLLGTLTYNFGEPPAPPPVVVPPPPPVVVTPPPARPVPPPPPPCNTGPYIVFFEWDKSDITPEGANILNNAVAAYANCGTAAVMLAGHADRSGAATYNVGLSQRRNAAVRQYLAGRGIPDARISTEAFGETKNRVPTADGVRELQNRRVEITYGPGSGM